MTVKETPLTKAEVKGAVETLTKIRNIFGKKGQYWIQGALHQKLATGDIGFCLVGAKSKVDGEYEALAGDLMALAIVVMNGDDLQSRGKRRVENAIIQKNDDDYVTFEQIKKVITKAKRLALGGRVRVTKSTIGVS